VQLSDVAAAINDRSQMIADINKAIDDADISLRAANEMPCHDPTAVSSRLALLQVLCICNCFVMNSG